MRLNDLKIAVVGATGNVGHVMLSILAERGVKPTQVAAIASSRSQGREVSFGEDAVLKVTSLDHFDFQGTDLVLSAPGSDVSQQYVPRALEAKCYVVDKTSCFRMDPRVPLVVPEVNGDILASHPSRLVAVPNCSTIQLVMALKPLQMLSPIKRVVCATYQSTSGAGRQGSEELYQQSRGMFTNQLVPAKKFSRPIAFNVIPQIDVFLSDGFTKEEQKMRLETDKIMGTSCNVIATCARVPVFIGHAMAVHVEFEQNVSVKEAQQSLRQFKGVLLAPDPQNFITSAECAGEDAVYVSRLRQDPSVENGLAFWVVADNVRKGAALNGIQIAETLLKCGKFTS